jgi:hypothetical protein
MQTRAAQRYMHRCMPNPSIPPCRKQFITSGTTALVLLVDGYKLALANVGDSRALIVQSDGSARFINEPHTPAMPGERDRIVECMWLGLTFAICMAAQG